ncbi:MAG: phosphatase PAP2 family protein [Bacteroidales bacterium]
MIEYFDALDKNLLLLLNGSGNQYWDNFMWLFTGKLLWVPAALGFIYSFLRKGWREGLMVLLFIVVVITLCDQISSGFFKPFFERLRPGHQPVYQDMLTFVNNYRGGKYGFVSSHAANSFGFAVFTSLLFKRRLFTLSVLSWAVINTYSRLYLGVHFPGDVLVGGMIGVIVAYLLYQLYDVMHRMLFERFRLSRPTDPYKGEIPWVPQTILWITVLGLAIASPFITIG